MKPHLRCRIHGHQWNDNGLRYFNEFDCDRCGHHQSPYDPEPPYLLRPWHYFRHWWDWRRSKLSWQRYRLSRYLHRLIGRKHPDDDIPF
jgi:hypothetical protein